MTRAPALDVALSSSSPSQPIRSSSGRTSWRQSLRYARSAPQTVVAGDVPSGANSVLELVAAAARDAKGSSAEHRQESLEVVLLERDVRVDLDDDVRRVAGKSCAPPPCRAPDDRAAARRDSPCGSQQDVDPVDAPRRARVQDRACRRWNRCRRSASAGRGRLGGETRRRGGQVRRPRSRTGVTTAYASRRRPVMARSGLASRARVGTETARGR